ncbi:MAG TPA: TonB-dependent receptor, partial [Steroidobacter sp.]
HGSFSRSAVSALVLAGLGSSAAFAQTAPLSAVEEVIVTASKRAENIQTVASSVSVLGAEDLATLHAGQLSDYAGYVPGLIVNSNGTPGQSTLILRGIAPLGDSAAVATYIDDSPLGASDGHSKASNFALDLFPYDIQRIEVLRGPQGTLYGASSLGGVLKYVTVAPDPSKLAVRFGAEVSDIEGASDAAWNARASVNVPLIEDKLALMASYFDKTEPGYVSNGVTGRQDENSNDVNGGRVAVLWNVSSNLTVKLSAMFQNIDSDDNSTMALDPATLEPIYGDLTSAHLLPQPYEQRLRFYSATINWTLDWADFVSASSYSENRNHRDQDLSGQLGPLFPLFGLPPGLVPYEGRLSLEKITQEFRLVSRPGESFDWLVGAFFTDEDSVNDQTLHALDSSQTPLPFPFDPLGVSSQQTKYREYALFGELTYKFSDAFSVTAGLRGAHNAQDFKFISGGLLGGPPTGGESDEDSLLYSFSPRLFLSEKTMIYFRAANGYRPGGPNGVLPGLNIPPSVDADTTDNYELGLKTELAGNLIANISVFRVDWNDIQLVTNDVVNYTANGGAARSQGAELTIDYSPIAGLSLGLNGAFTDAELTQDAAAIDGLDGDRLPGVPRWSGSATARYSKTVLGSWTAQVGLGYRYVGETLSGVSSSSAVVRAPSYKSLDLDARLMNANWTVSVFAKNVTDERGLIAPTFNGDAQVDTAFIRPRTIGLAVDWSF